MGEQREVMGELNSGALGVGTTVRALDVATCGHPAIMHSLDCRVRRRAAWHWPMRASATTAIKMILQTAIAFQWPEQWSKPGPHLMRERLVLV